MLNVGAGTGSYEPRDRDVVAVDPSSVMLAQRPAGSAPAVQARAEALPFDDASFDAVLGVLTLHHWDDQRRGLRECIRVARDRVVVVTFDPAGDGFWLSRRYLPELAELDRRQFPTMSELREAFGIGTTVTVQPLPIPSDCIDGFLGAFWARPHAYLDPLVRAGISSFARIDAGAGLARLRADLSSGAWEMAHGHLRSLSTLDIGYKIIVARRSSRASSPSPGP